MGRVFITSLVLLLSALPGVASAQVMLDGNFIDYLNVGADGTMISAGRSMRYRESSATGEPYSCDLWAPDDSVSTFTVRATGVSLLGLFSNFSGTNGGGGFFDINTTTPTAVSGRAITWTGHVGAALLANGDLRVAHRWTFNPDDRVVVQTITLTNIGTPELRDIYYVAHGDPDHGNCSIGTSNDTRNDVVRQQNAAGTGSALVVARTIAAATREVVYGMGSFDPDVRVSVSAGLQNTDPQGTWNTPLDPNGAVGDRGLSLALRVLTLASGASRTFTIYHVWSGSVGDAGDRLDDAHCGVLGEGTVCGAGGAAGMCRGGDCCTGCWNGTSCSTGTAATACGVAGGACTTCEDTNVCTTDTCTAGVCARTNNTLACDDGAFCTTTDTCAAGACVPGPARSCGDSLDCTTDACDEVTNACTNAITGGGCAIGGMCVAGGGVNAADACLSCIPATSTTMWTYFASPTCDGDGDSVPDLVEAPGGTSMDTDMDGDPDHMDADDDGDGIPTLEERPGDESIDTDMDGTPNYLDGDDDGDGILSIDEVTDEAAEGGDVDTDGTPAYLDLDSDADGVGDITEGRGDLDTDGVPNYLDPDSFPTDMDGDGVPDSVECPSVPCRDTDMDGMPDQNDPDDDGDGIPTRVELTDETLEGGDVDEDGTPAYLDLDSDGDGVPDRDEGTADDDGDEVPNYLDPLSPDTDAGVRDGGVGDGGVGDGGVGDGGVGDGGNLDGGMGDGGENPTRPGGLSGGALCSVSAVGTNTGGHALLGLLSLLGLALLRRRRA
jgi:MYXO-CTERM domain-containing protein